MTYQLRLHSQIRAWLTDLRDTEPELARRAGEALLALIDAGEALGPPLVFPLESVLGRPEDPREALDLSYQRQLERLTQVRRGVADVATSRKRLELQISSLEQQVAGLARQREEALRVGREDLAEEAGARAAGIEEQLSGLRRQFAVLRAEEENLSRASQRLQARVEAFRVRKETIKASYTAAEASQSAREAMADLDAETGGPEPSAGEGPSSASGHAGTMGEAFVRRVRVSRGPLGDMREVLYEGPAEEGGCGPGDTEDVPVPPGMMELRPGAPDDVRVGLLFVVEPQDTATVVAYVRDPAGSFDGYRGALRIAAERLPAGAGDQAAAPDDAFNSYDAESFLDEFFPGAETEVEIGAGALVARSRANTLAEARQRMRLTQAQMARRMNVRQERVSAIERAEPGATEVRTLAAYVAALGGRLEIVAHIGGERILLR
jgi:DNA-binding XRE family transcriptional regulator